MNSSNNVEIKNIGSFANEILINNLGGFVIGKTKSGIFVKTLTDKIVFITHLPYAGPLTINLNQDNTNKVNLINLGMEVNFSPEKVSIPEIGLDILTSKNDLYVSPLPSATVRSKEERRKTIRVIASQMNSYLDEENNPQYSSLLEIINYGDKNSKLSQSSEFNHISQIVRDIQIHRFEKVLEGINKLLGSGQGLTPSGDDIVIGIILSINRWKDVLIPKIVLGSFNQQVIQAGYDRTTTLSANLIECAAQGEADERLVNTIDFLISDLPYKKNIAVNLLGWGNSSGIFAFLGMAITLMRMDK